MMPITANSRLVPCRSSLLFCFYFISPWRSGTSRVAKAVLIGAVPSLMLKTARTLAAGRGIQGVDANTIWITEAWDSKASHDASLSLPKVKDAIAKGKPLIAGFGDSIVTTPGGGQGVGAQRPA